jgi:phosphoesterase RecJ-like protein
MTTIDWPAFTELIAQHQRYLLTSHIRPDCDALGSELGMAGVLEALGKEVRIVNGQATPPNLVFIDPQQKIETIGQNVTPEELVDIEVLMILDTSAWAQLGPMGDVIRSTNARKVLVDHHVGEDDLGATPFKNTTAEATGRLVVEAAEHLGVALTKEIATPLFAAIATDTGWYRFGSTTSGTYRTAAKLVDAGAVPSDIFGALYERDSLARVKLRGRITERFVTELDGRLAHTSVRLADFEQTGALPSDTEDVINIGLGILGTEVAVILVELSSGGFKISFRSRCELKCNEVAEQFGGGGHKAAAGAFIDEPFDVAQQQVLDALRAAMG